MTIPEDMIMKHLDYQLNQSDPGDMLHHLSVLAAPADAVTPFGSIDPDKIHTSIWAIAPVGSGTAESLISGAVLRAMGEAKTEGHIIAFAALSQEMWTVPDPDDHARQLLADGRPLGEHPRAVEVTVIYGATRDGRRWRGRRYLTGDKAGTTEDVELLVGHPHRYEGQAIAAAQLIRRMVGQNA